MVVHSASVRRVSTICFTRSPICVVSTLRRYFTHQTKWYVSKYVECAPDSSSYFTLALYYTNCQDNPNVSSFLRVMLWKPRRTVDRLFAVDTIHLRPEGSETSC